MSLLALPTEINIAIFQLACMDGGYTACSLSLTCRRFFPLARPLIYQSISVAGIMQLQALAMHLLRSPKLARTVRHLFILEMDEHQVDDFQMRFGDEGATLSILVNFIFGLVSPYLETLCYLCPLSDYFEDCSQMLSRRSWPHLTELTVRGYAGLYHARTFPSLERFHLYTPGLSHQNTVDGLALLDQTFPRLTHLKITGIGFNSAFFLDMLGRKWGVTYESGAHFSVVYPNRRLAQFPPSLQCIAIQMRVPSERNSVVRRRRHKIMMKKVREWAEAVEEHGLVLHKPMKREKHYVQAKKDWLDRLEGGHGGWANESDGRGRRSLRKKAMSGCAVQ
ncbi:hypothetical protein BOTBODRAFT_184608 [Botryobasidium botryosum FD-172 SS1]|uniref:F-box domain-containing protein n=1 Tax=Botryobasidium botryosum (strain FD-172 SS1) TaxID=930990 RepID=A0A067MVK5_BOTB1|nr:hypothetical protein BOTBODRAFT_184608 [Botryobasidium botryosum FD-172 SS1]